MATYGYVRVSTKRQELALQLDALKAAGCQEQNIFRDKVSGAKTARPGLEAMLNALQPGDKVVVWRLDRLGRSLVHLVDLINGFRDKQVDFVSLNESIDTTSAVGELIFHVMAALAQFERALTRERVLAGLEVAKANGSRLGPKPKIDKAKLGTAERELAAGRTINEVSRTLGISRVTLWRYLNGHSVAV